MGKETRHLIWLYSRDIGLHRSQALIGLIELRRQALKRLNPGAGFRIDPRVRRAGHKVHGGDGGDRSAGLQDPLHFGHRLFRVRNACEEGVAGHQIKRRVLKWERQCVSHDKFDGESGGGFPCIADERLLQVEAHRADVLAARGQQACKVSGAASHIQNANAVPHPAPASNQRLVLRQNQEHSGLFQKFGSLKIN